MLGNFVIGGGSGSPSKNRVFVYEVTGLRQNEVNDGNNYSFRSSSSVFVSVPYARMNEEMQRIGRMGGTIINIKPLDDSHHASEATDSDSDNSEQAQKTKKAKK